MAVLGAPPYVWVGQGSEPPSCGGVYADRAVGLLPLNLQAARLPPLRKWRPQRPLRSVSSPLPLLAGHHTLPVVVWLIQGNVFWAFAAHAPLPSRPV